MSIILLPKAGFETARVHNYFTIQRKRGCGFHRNPLILVVGHEGFGYFASDLPVSGCVASPRPPDARIPARFSSLFGQRPLLRHPWRPRHSAIHGQRRVRFESFRGTTQ